MKSPEPNPTNAITGLILAGGKGRRMLGKDKGLIEYQGKALIEYALRALTPVTRHILISANRNQSHYAQYDHPVISDETADFSGPLAGILAGLTTSTESLLVCPCDAPFVTSECFQRLHSALASNIRCTVAHDGKRLQPMFLALAEGCREDLESFFATGERKLENWVRQLNPIIVDCSDHPGMVRQCEFPC